TVTPFGHRSLLLWPVVATTLLLMSETPVRASQAASPTLDFQYYRTQVEPIFLKPRAVSEGAGRPCASCATTVARRLRVQPLPAAATAWREEQSRQNFQAAAGLVTPGDPLTSRLLLHPLATQAGGDPTHTGGKFWPTQDNQEWQALAAWVRGSSAPGSAA